MSVGCITPPGGLPSIVDASKVRILQSSLVALIAHPGDLLAVQAPVQVPQGRHWIVTAASILAGVVGVPAGNLYASIFKANAAAMGQVAGLVAAGVDLDASVMTTYLRGIAATLIPTLLMSGTVTAPNFAAWLPYFIVESGQVLAALAVPNIFLPQAFELSFSFAYIERENAAC